MIALEDLQVYRDSMGLAEEVWELVCRWPSFPKQTMGRQLVRASDSIAANLAEGHGRYHFGERRQFAYYARGSLIETETWIRKAAKRGLIKDTELKELEVRSRRLGRMLNGYIRSIRPRSIGTS